MDTDNPAKTVVTRFWTLTFFGANDFEAASALLHDEMLKVLRRQ